MKKALLATTAVAGLAYAMQPAHAQQVATSQPFTVTLGGFLNTYAAYVDGENQLPTTNRANRVRFLNDGELFFTIQAKSDNGLVYGFRVELEVVNGETATVNGSTPALTGTNLVDEANFYAQGGFGRVELGNEDSFANRFFGFQPLAWTQVTGYGTYSNTGFLNKMTVLNNLQMEGLQQKVFDSSDATKVSYATPIFAGFQAGISYAPDGQSDTGALARLNDTINTNPTIPGVLLTDVSGGMLLRGGHTNFVETGVTYSANFGSVGTRIGATYNFADAKKAPVGGLSYEDFSGFGIGGLVTFAGFSLGASYIYEGDSRLPTARAYGDDAWGFNITGQYVIGPWAIGGYYAKSQMEGASARGTTTVNGVAVSNSGDDMLRTIGAGVGYTVAPGLSLHFAVVDFEFKDEGRTANEGTIYTLATRIAF